MWYFASTSSRSDQPPVFELTLRKYLMFLLWKSPGGSNRYRSSSHKSRRKPGNTHPTHTFYRERATRWCQRVFTTVWRARQSWAYLPRPYVTCTPCLDKSSSPSPPQPQRTSPPAPLWCPLLRKRQMSKLVRHVLIASLSVSGRRLKVSVGLLCLSSLSARRSWAFRNTRKWVAKSSTRRVVK